MQRLMTGLIGITALLTGCSGGDAPEPTPSPSAVEGTGLNYIAEVEKLPEAQQHIVFIRAIRDARRECQGVVGSVKATEIGPGAWRVRCTDGGGHLIRISANGDGRVTSSR